MQTGAAYIRVSTDEQIEFSPDSQIKKIKEYALYHDIFLPEEFIYIDEGISGKYAKNRPAFMKMIGTAKLKPSPFEVILVWKFSRFARNRQDSIFYKSMLRKECKVDIISITEQLSDDSTSILIEAMLEAMDEYYSINLAQEVRRGMNEKFSRGGVVSMPPFGYKMGEKHFEADAESAAVVRMIFDDFVSGMSYRAIASKINKIGIRTRRGNPFESRSVEYILSNPVYIGKQRRSLNGADSNDRFHCSENTSVVKAEHIAIIDEDKFYNVQRKIKDMKRAYYKSSGEHSRFMLQGLIRCSNCNSVLIKTSNGKGLQCCKYGKGQCMVSHYITIDKINTAVLEKIEKDLGNGQIVVNVSDEKNPTSEAVIKAGIMKGQRKLERIKEAYEAGIDDIEEYRIKKSNALKCIEGLRSMAYSQVKKKDGTANTCRICMGKLVRITKSGGVSEEEKNEILCAFVSSVEFNSRNRSFQIHYYI